MSAAPPDIIEQIARIFAVSTEHQDFRPGEGVWRGPSVHREYLRRAQEAYEVAITECARSAQDVADGFKYSDGSPTHSSLHVEKAVKAIRALAEPKS